MLLSKCSNRGRPYGVGLVACSVGSVNYFAVAAAAVALGLFQALRGADRLSLGDFQAALLTSAVLMAIAVGWTWRMPADAGAQLAVGTTRERTRAKAH